jgi:hypothetical protein
MAFFPQILAEVAKVAAQEVVRRGVDAPALRIPESG